MPDEVPSLRMSPKQEQAAKLIARGWRKAETARDPRVNVSVSTMQRWTTEDEAFMQRVRDLRTSVDLRATELLQESLDRAANVVAAALSGDDMDVDVECRKCNARITCQGCGDDAEPVARAALKDRVATAKWLLDLHYKGKLPEMPGAVRDETEETVEALGDDEYSDLARRGQVDESDPFETDELGEE